MLGEKQPWGRLYDFGWFSIWYVHPGMREGGKAWRLHRHDPKKLGKITEIIPK